MVDRRRGSFSFFPFSFFFFSEKVARDSFDPGKKGRRG